MGERTIIHYTIFVLMVIVELFTSSIVILLPSYAGPPPIAEHCHSASEYRECSEEFFHHDEEYANHTGPYKHRLKVTFIVYATTSTIRIILSLIAVFYLAGHRWRKVICRIDGVALTGFATCIAYGTLIFSVWHNYALEDNQLLKAFAIIAYTFLIMSIVWHIRAMVLYFPWNYWLFFTYKMIRVIAVALFLFVEAYSEHLELQSTVVFIIVTLEFLHELFEYVEEGFEEFHHQEKKGGHGDDAYHSFD